MARVVLFFPSPYSATRMYTGLPLAILGASRVLHGEGVPISIVAKNLYPDCQEKILEECRDAVCFGISAMTGYQIEEGLQIAAVVKKQFPKLPIVWGGWHPSILPEETARDERVDFVVRGQGERTLADLYHALEKGSATDEIPGLTFRRNGQVFSTPDRFPESLNNFPPIPYELVDIEKCVLASEIGKRTLSYYSSYGCPGRCAFCVERIVNKRHWASESADRIIAAAESLVARYSIDGLALFDSNFFAEPGRVRRFCELKLEKKIPINWGSANGRPDQLSRYSDNDWALISKSGCKTILIGAESGWQETLDQIHKDTKVEDTLGTAEKAGRFDVKVFFSFLVGLPWTNDPVDARRRVETEFSKTLDLIEKLRHMARRQRIMIFPYLPYPSNALMDKAMELGLELPNSLEGWSKYLLAAEDSTKIVPFQKWLTKKDMLKTLMISSYIFFFLDADSIDFIRTRVSNPLLRVTGYAAFYIFKAICATRWRMRYFGCPVDFHFYYFLRRTLNIA